MIVLRLVADAPGKLAFSAQLNRPELATTRTVGQDQLLMTGRLWRDGGPSGLKFAARVQIVLDGGGVVRARDEWLRVEGATSATVFIAAATDYRPVGPTFRGADPEPVTARTLAAARALPYDRLRARHVADHAALFNRVALDLGRTPAADLPTDERLLAFARGGDDPALAALYFQYGRYLLIASSRPGDSARELAGLLGRRRADALERRLPPQHQRRR